MVLYGLYGLSIYYIVGLCHGDIAVMGNKTPIKCDTKTVIVILYYVCVASGGLVPAVQGKEGTLGIGSSSIGERGHEAGRSDAYNMSGHGVSCQCSKKSSSPFQSSCLAKGVE